MACACLAGQQVVGWSVNPSQKPSKRLVQEYANPETVSGRCRCRCRNRPLRTLDDDIDNDNEGSRSRD